MTETTVLKWIKQHLGGYIQKALSDHRGTIYSEDWLGAMAYREIGMLLHRFLPSATSLPIIAPLMKGDYSRRSGEPEKSYHGFGFWQIDIGSYPAFVKSGDWKDPYKCCMQAIAVLEEKKKYLQTHILYCKEFDLARAITAAYNCGQGNVVKAFNIGMDPDTYTFNRDYSKEVWRFREIYKSL